MTRLMVLCCSTLFLCGCSVNSGISQEIQSEFKSSIVFESELPVLTVNGVSFKVGELPTQSMFDEVKKFYKSEEQYQNDYNAILPASDNYKKFHSTVTENDEAYYTFRNQTRIIFGGQVEDGSYLEFTVSNLSDKDLLSLDCTVINTSVIYGNSIESVKLNDESIETVNDFVSLLGDYYVIKDVTEYDYIYSYMYSYDLSSSVNITFLVDDSENVVGIQENDIGLFLSKFFN